MSAINCFCLQDTTNTDVLIVRKELVEEEHKTGKIKKGFTAHDQSE
jgi:hypothetical protein